MYNAAVLWFKLLLVISFNKCTVIMCADLDAVDY